MSMPRRRSVGGGYASRQVTPEGAMRFGQDPALAALDATGRDVRRPPLPGGVGFDRPLEIIVGCGAAGMALYCVAALIIGRTSGNAEVTDAG
ncbi:hypothetical protein [Micromonospora sp. DT62]|uniref:hypothetical protein n=1 Tax=Micromonospora sp. DT62 TaxID=3416521 RepID=UPI003CF8DF64